MRRSALLIRPLAAPAIRPLVTLVGICLVARLACAAPPPPRLEDLPDAPPPPPAPVRSGETFDPGLDAPIVINRTERADAVIEEYSVNGKVFLIKITPAVGRPYIIADNDGDGTFDERLSTLYSDPIVPKWVLFSW